MTSNSITIDLAGNLGPMNINHMGLGQGGLSSEPIWDNRIAEIKALQPKMVRLFIQEFFDLLPEPGKYHFDKLDRSVDTIRATGAEPLMCICFKPKVLFPKIDQHIVEPEDYDAWEKLIVELVNHYKKRKAHIRYWEVANEPDIGEAGGCPYYFTPESYVRYYQHTSAAILRADPAARVGGPALAYVRSPILTALIEACATTPLPLHFISWHIYTNNPLDLRNTIEYAQEQLAKFPSLNVETILNEWCIQLGVNTLGTDPRFLCCYIPETVWQMKDAGLDYSCYYHIRDYHVDEQEMATFFSAHGAAYMARWWNRMPQAGGLFDFQNTMRPAYFSFKMLSRLKGNKLPVTSTTATLHALAAHDTAYNMSVIMFWNFSDKPVDCSLILNNVKPESKAVPFLLDALSPSNDENHRIKLFDEIELSGGSFSQSLTIEPWGVHLWYVHGKSWAIED